MPRARTARAVQTLPRVPSNDTQNLKGLEGGMGLGVGERITDQDCEALMHWEVGGATHATRTATPMAPWREQR